jgi:hypothetical protein
MLGTVIEVSAMFVEMINFLVFGGVGLKMACCCTIGSEEYRQ